MSLFLPVPGSVLTPVPLWELKNRSWFLFRNCPTLLFSPFTGTALCWHQSKDSLENLTCFSHSPLPLHTHISESHVLQSFLVLDILLFISNAQQMSGNPYFVHKIPDSLSLCAGLNYDTLLSMILQLCVSSSIMCWDRSLYLALLKFYSRLFCAVKGFFCSQD